MRSVVIVAALVGALALSAGCGQRGPLVLPDAKHRPPATSAPPTQPSAR